MFPLFRSTVAAALLCGAIPVHAADFIPTRVGQNLDEHSGTLESVCENLVIAEADDGDFAITCHLSDDAYLTANATRLKRIYWVAYNELAEDPDDFSARVRSALGYEGDGVPCEYFGRPCLLWTRGDEELRIGLERNSIGHLAAWQINDTIEREDAR